MDFWDTALDVILTALVSMTPVLELRAAIPFGVANDLGIWPSVIISIIGNLIPVPFIILFIRQIFAFMRKLSPKLDKLVTKLEQRAEKKSGVVQKCAFWGLFILVAIPLPGTGAWTGALVAAMLDMRLKRAFPTIALGVTAAAIIVTFITYGADKLLF